MVGARRIGGKLGSLSSRMGDVQLAVQIRRLKCPSIQLSSRVARSARRSETRSRSLSHARAAGCSRASAIPTPRSRRAAARLICVRGAQRFEDGKLTTESFEGELEGNAYDQLIRQTQQYIANQTEQFLRLFSLFLPLSTKRPSDRD